MERITNQRAGHKGGLTTFLRTIENLLTEAEEAGTNTDKIDKISAKLSLATSKLEKIKTLDTQLLELTNDEDLTKTIEENETYTDEITETLFLLNKRLERLIRPTTTTTTIPTPPDTTTIRGLHTKRKVNLPKLSLPIFNGDILKWPEFIDGFTSAIDSDESLENIQKFQYLRAQLNGEAAKAIEGLGLTNANYKEAVELLKDRYGQPFKVQSAHMKALWSITAPTGDADALREFSDTLESHIRSLKALEKNEDTYGDLLVLVLLDKIPWNIRSAMAREHGSDTWTLEEFRKSLLKEIDAIQAGANSLRNMCSASSFSHAQTAQALFTNAKPIATNHTNYAAKSNQFNHNKVFKCKFCDGIHKNADCNISDHRIRLSIVKQKQLCTNCLRKGHRYRDCESQFRCKTCNQKHHTSLHFALDVKKPKSAKFAFTQESGQRTIHANSVSADFAKSGNVLLKTAVADASGSHTNKRIQVGILFDEGSTKSFITADLASELNIKPDVVSTINLAIFGSEAKPQEVGNATVNVKTTTGLQVPINCLIVPKICAPINNAVSADVLKLPYLRGLRLAQPIAGKKPLGISILIGADFYWRFVGDHVIRGEGPTAVESSLGYLLSGPTSSRDQTFPTEVRSFHVSVDQLASPEPLNQLWDLEVIGITDAQDMTQPNDYKAFCDKYIEKRENQYVSKLPWKSDHTYLPTNYTVAKARTRNMIKRLSPDIIKVYDRIIKEQENRKFIERIYEDDNKHGHYLPHHCVKKDSLTTPIRVVYDCSCSVGNTPSLNDCLQKGPHLLNDLLGILMRFRLHPVAYSSDIEKAFLHVGLHEEDRDFTKFLWLSDPEEPDSEFVVYRFSSVLFGSVSSPAILNAVIKKHLESNESPTAKELSENIYVDNVFGGGHSDESVVSSYKESNEIVSSGGFTLRSWATNSPVLKEIASKDGVLHEEKNAPMLGHLWDTSKDTMGYKQYVHESIQSNGTLTKREVVKRVSSLYDPLGFLSPVHVQAKTFIQSLWKQNLDWDDSLSQENTNTWINIEQDLSHASEIHIPRFTPTFDENELICFVDSSIKAYGATVYLRNTLGTNLIIAKSRVAPVKELTLPRLELMAAVIGTRLTKFAQNQLSGTVKISKRVLFSDSQIVLHWIKNKHDKPLPVFVKNRIEEIKEFKFDEHRYIPTDENPADLLTRGITAQKLKDSNLWWHGPKLQIWTSPDSDADADEPTSMEHVNVVQNNAEIFGIDQIIDIERFSSLSKLKRVTALVLRFISNLQLATQNRKNTEHKLIKLDVLDANELSFAHQRWIQCIQMSRYAKELEKLTCVKKHIPPPLIRQLKLFVDKQGIIRCGGRLQNAPISEFAKFPILLPPDHFFTKLLIEEAHRKTLHSGLQATLTLLRQTYWIVKARTTVKSVLRKCWICKLVSGKHYPAPIFAPLPKCRLQKSHPFQITGVDFTGELYVKTESGQQKCYICLFTCANTRAVHLELVTSLSKDSFLRAFRRFSARRSLPTKVISDNATTFISASNELKELLENPAVQNYMANLSVEWTHIVKRAPFWGGFYERMIGLTKTTLKKVLGRAFVNLDELYTILCEIETTLNNRPITYVYGDDAEAIALTPSHLLHGRMLNTLPNVTDAEEELADPTYETRTTMTKRLTMLAEVQNRFWARWEHEYLTALRERHQLQKQGHLTNIIQQGDVVLVHSDDKKRLLWDLAVVESLITGNDGVVRAANIRTKHGRTNRPIIKLYPLEVSCDYADSSETPDTRKTKSLTPKKDAQPVQTNVRSKRNAAKRAELKIKNWITDSDV